MGGCERDLLALPRRALARDYGAVRLLGMTSAIAQYFDTRTRRRTAYFVLGNLAIFLALLGMMFYYRWVSEQWPTPFHFPSLLMAGALTMFALCGSVTMAIGAEAAKLPTTEAAVRWIAIAISSWLVFLFLEIVE